MAGPLPPGDCLAVVVRSGKPEVAEVLAWSIRRPLPAIPIPLEPPDPDVPVDLAALVATAYERGRMKSPFPGMDPYIEDQGRWQDFHGRDDHLLPGMS